MARDDDATLDDLLGDMREMNRNFEKMEKLLTIITGAITTLTATAIDIRSILEIKTGVDLSKVYRSPKKPDNPEC